MTCKHCNRGFTCGCQKTKANDGNTVHKTCVKVYNGTTPNTKKHYPPVADNLTRKINASRRK